MNPCMKLATLLKEQGLLSVQVKEKLTVNSEVVVEYLEEWERVPSVSGLLPKHLVHVYCKQRPEDLCVLNQKITKPGERLTNKQFTTIIPHQNEPNHPSRKQSTQNKPFLSIVHEHKLTLLARCAFKDSLDQTASLYKLQFFNGLPAPLK